MNKYILFLSLSLTSMFSFASELLIHTGSIHQQSTFQELHNTTNKPINNTNTGVGFRNDNGYVFGAYKNSYYKNTIYAAKEFMLNENIGVVIGGASGYKHTSGYTITPVINLLVKYQVNDVMTLNVTAIPTIGKNIGVVHLVTSFKF